MRTDPPVHWAAHARRPVVVATVAIVAAVAMLAGCTSSPPSLNAPEGDVTETTTPSPPDPAELAAEVVGRLSDEELVGQVLMPSVSLASDPEDAAALVREYRLGGVVVMGNVEQQRGGSATHVRALTDAMREAAAEFGAEPGIPNLLTATDQEYGWVTRITSGMVQLPSAMAFGAAARPDLTEAAWRGAGGELLAAGINVDFAPDADVLGPPNNYVIGSRSYGSDPAVAAEQVAAAVRGLQSAGVAATIKHFPGHGKTSVNSHVALPVLSQSREELERHDLVPFRAGIHAGAWLVMSGHLDVRALDRGVPASFSSDVLIDLLRDELGFTGVVVSDALNMEPARRWPPGEAAVRALVAGNDLLLMPPNLAAARKGLLDGLADGSLPRERLREAVLRVLTLKFRLAAFDAPDPSRVDLPENWEAARAVAAAAVTVLAGSCSGPLVGDRVRITTSAGRSQQASWLAEALAAHGITAGADGDVVHLVGYGDGSSDLSARAAVTVAMDTPYVLASARSPVRIATYSSTEVAMQALAGFLAGGAPAPGRSPVAVNGLPDSACAG